MAHLQYMPGDPRLVDQLVYELKSKGIFDQFRKECISDVDTRPAYQNLRQRVESSVAVFLSRQTWKPDLNKNQLREKLRKHILDGNYLEQGVERIVDQVVNPKVAAVFKPQVEDLVYNYLGIPRKRTPKPEATEKTEDLLPTDLEAVSPGSVKSNDGGSKDLENNVEDMEIDSVEKLEVTEDMSTDAHKDDIVEVSSDSSSLDKSSIPLPTEEIKLENIPAPENSPKPAKIELENIELPIELEKPANIELKNIELPKEPNPSTDIPLPDEVTIPSNNTFFTPLALHSEESNSSSGSSIRRNMSPLTPVRNFDDENSCDAQQAFENNSDDNNHKEPSKFQFNIEAKESFGSSDEAKLSLDSSDVKVDKKETEQLSEQFTSQVNINTYNTPMYDDSSNSHNLQIDYESDANTNTSKTTEVKQDVENSEDSKKERNDDKKNHKSSHRSRDSSRHSSSKDKHSSSRDSSRHEKKSSSKDDKSKSSKDRATSKDRSDRKDSSKYKSSHKSSSSSKDKHRSSSSSHNKHSSNKSSDERKSSSKDKSSEKDKEKSSDKDKSSRDRKESKSSSHRVKDRKCTKKDDKDKKKEKKDTDDHYSSSGRGNHSRRSTDRDSNDGSSTSKGSQSQNNSKQSADSTKESKSTSSKSDNTSSSESTSQSDKEHVVTNKVLQCKPIVRVDNHLETPIANPPRLPFVPDVTLKKPKFANNFEEAKKMMKMRKFLAEEQKRMNQEAALLLEFQANVRPSLSQVYSSIPGPELEFACVTHPDTVPQKIPEDDKSKVPVNIEICDTVIPEIIVDSSDEPLEIKQITNDTKDIINDIIGVPIKENNKQMNDDVIETDFVEAPIVMKTEETKHNSYEDTQPLQTKNEIITHNNSSERCQDALEESLAEIVHDNSTEFEITVTAETLSETDVSEILEMKEEEPKFSEKQLQYFAEHEKYNAELERHKFSNFLDKYIKSTNISNKLYVINCDTYEENIVKEVASNFGDYEIVNYHKNGLRVPNKNIVKDVPLSSEISLPLDSKDYEENSPLFSPVKSECSFELSSDYDAKLDEIVNMKSRQEVMEIILGGTIDEPSKMPTIDYYTELSDNENSLTIVEDNITEDTLAEVKTESTLKRRIEDQAGNNNRSVLTPYKIRKMSDSDQISSTTDEPEMSNNNKIQTTARSKYLGRAKRVGLPKPKKCNLPNSPSSDKSVENYTQNTLTPNGKLKTTPRSKVQRYETSDLYKPKLHYLSRRNNIS